ncbi:MAG: PA14 domain-containing protein, partial [Gemmatimonadales bacterium]
NGLLVWQDMPSASIPLVSDTSDRTTDTAATREFEAELVRVIHTHWNHPSIVMWVPFNEGWGQYDTPRIARLVKETDPTRLVDEASGWHERHAGDVVDHHNYPPPLPPRPEPGRAAVQGEYGGLGLVVKGHTWKEGGWGYDLFGSREALAGRFEDFVRVLQRAERDEGLSAAVYTQTSDVETENNGLLTYDRAEAKIAPQTVRLVLRGIFPPQLSRTAPIFVDTVRVAFAPVESGVEIRYTTDGIPPRRSSPLYHGPVLLDHTATVRARAYYPDGTPSRVSSHGFAQVEPGPATPVDEAAHGLLADFLAQDGSWRHLPVFDSLRVDRTTVVTRIGLEPANARRENFGLRFRGYIGVPVTGVYTFHLSSDDGSRLRIDGQTIIEHDGIHGMSERTGWVALQAGMHVFDLAYFQGCCGIGLTLEMDAPGRSRGPIPPWWFFHEAPARPHVSHPGPGSSPRQAPLNRAA